MMMQMRVVVMVGGRGGGWCFLKVYYVQNCTPSKILWAGTIDNQFSDEETKGCDWLSGKACISVQLFTP